MMEQENIKVGDKLFYCNRECEVLAAPLANNNVLIELESHHFDEDNMYNAENATIIINNRYLSKNKIDFEAEIDANEEAVRKKLCVEHEKLNKVKSEMIGLKKSLEAMGELSFISDLFEGKDFWVLDISGKWEIKKLSELTTSEGWGGGEKLRAITFIREKRKEKVKFKVCSYSDGSGYAEERFIPFRTKQEAIDNAIDRMRKEGRPELYTKLCEKHGIHLDFVEEFKARVVTRSKESRDKERLKLERRLEKLKSEE